MDFDKRLVSVEVKRLIGNELPVDSRTNSRRKIWERNKITWPWKKTVLSALEKANPEIVKEYGITSHHIVFLVPDTLSKHSSSRLEKRALSVVEMYVSFLSVKRVFVHFLPTPSHHFDRF